MSCLQNYRTDPSSTLKISTFTQNLYLSPSPSSPWSPTSPSSFSPICTLDASPSLSFCVSCPDVLSTVNIFSITASRTFSPHPSLSSSSAPGLSSLLSNQIKSDQIRSDQIRSDQIKPNQTRPNQIKPNQIKSN